MGFSLEQTQDSYTHIHMQGWRVVEEWGGETRRVDSNLGIFKPATTLGNWSLIPLHELWDSFRVLGLGCF